MNKNLKVLGGIVLVVVLGMIVWFLVGKQSQKDMDLRQDIVEVKSDNQQEEKQAVKENSQEQSEEKVEELKVEDTKSIKPKFGIDDSGLKYNNDGSVDTSDWKMSNTLVEFSYPKSWSRLDGVYNTSKPNYPATSGQVSFTMVGFGAPFDVDMFSDKGRDELLVDAVNYAVNSTEKYAKKYNGTCQKNKINKFNVYMKCRYKKDKKLNILYNRTFTHYDISGNGEKTGGSAGLNIEFGDLETLESNKKIINQILRSSHIGQVIGDEEFVLDEMYLK